MWTDEKVVYKTKPEPCALPCPFCGDKDIRRHQLWVKDSTPAGMRHEDGTLKWTYLECSQCGIQTSAYCYERQALKQWNQRVAVFTRMDTGMKDRKGNPIREGDEESGTD